MKTRAILGGAGLVVALALAATAAPHLAPAPARVVPPVIAAAPPAPPLPAITPPPVVQAPALPPVPQPPPARPVVEVVFVLDTTGSMDGLINGAKQKIWSIANHIASGQPTPIVRIGLVAYRDVGDAYVTRVYNLSDDLDKVYTRLMSFRADGGGDTPEHVWRALSDAVNKMQWSDTSMKMVFLVGDAPPHDDYGDGYSRSRILKQAALKEIAIHAIRAGDDPETARVWRSLAASGRGAYASINQGGGWRKSKTPMDERLAALSHELDETTVAYGDAEVHRRIRAKAAMGRGVGSSVAADRGSFYAVGGAKLDEGDVLEDIASGKMDVNKLEPAKMPEPMREMSPDARNAYVAAQKAKREAIMKEMKDLAVKRNEYLKAERKAAPPAAAPSMDDAVNSAVEAQGEASGIAY